MSANENQSQKSQADILREIIDEKIDNGFDFSSDSKKKELKEQIWTDNPTLFPNKGALASSFYKILKKQLVAHKKDPREFGMSARAPKISLGDSDMNTKIKLETAPTETTDAQKLEAAKQAQSSQSGSTASGSSAPFIATNIDEESLKATITALYLLPQKMIENLEGLTDEEKTSLGKLWLPFARNHLSKLQAEVVIPLIATVGIIAPKAAKARKITKEKKEKEKADKKAETEKNE